MLYQKRSFKMNDYMDNYLAVEKIKDLKKKIDEKINYLLDINGFLSIYLNDINLIDEYNHVFKVKLKINNESIFNLIIISYEDEFYLYKYLNNSSF